MSWLGWVIWGVVALGLGVPLFFTALTRFVDYRIAARRRKYKAWAAAKGFSVCEICDGANSKRYAVAAKCVIYSGELVKLRGLRWCLECLFIQYKHLPVMDYFRRCPSCGEAFFCDRFGDWREERGECWRCSDENYRLRDGSDVRHSFYGKCP